MSGLGWLLREWAQLALLQSGLGWLPWEWAQLALARWCWRHVVVTLVVVADLVVVAVRY